MDHVGHHSLSGVSIIKHGIMDSFRAYVERNCSIPTREAPEAGPNVLRSKAEIPQYLIRQDLGTQTFSSIPLTHITRAGAEIIRQPFSTDSQKLNVEFGA